MRKVKECEKSITGEHDWVYPRLEDSIDKDRQIIKTYCKYCYVKKETPENERLFSILFHRTLTD